MAVGIKLGLRVGDCDGSIDGIALGSNEGSMDG